jgi:4-amino-4-deoxy-L-arabinose transferase-like glycosyltransferase
LKKNLSIILRFVGLCFSILASLGGIIILRQGATIAGIIVTIIAAIIFVFLGIYNDKHPMSEEEALAYRPYLAPSLFWIASISIMLFIVSAMSNWDRPGSLNHWITIGWLGSLLCAIIGTLFAVNWRPDWKQFLENIKRNRVELIIVSCLLLVGLFFRIYIISDHPFPWSGDEASVGIEGERIISGEVTDFFESGWSGQPNWSFVPTALSLTIFGRNFFAIRLVSVLEGTLAILWLYLLARELFGRSIATLAAGFLVAYSCHLQFSRIGVNNIIDSMEVCFVLWLTVRAIRKGQVSDYVWAGLAGGLAFYTYVGSRLVLALAIFLLLYTVIRQRGYFRTHFLHLGVFLFSAILAITPLADYFIHHPDIFMTRLGQENIFTNHWLVNEANRTGVSITSILWKQFTDTILVYISQPAIGNFFNSSQPYLSVLGSIFFVFGMAYALVKISEPRMILILFWFWSVVFLGGVLTLSPPANTRLLMTSPVVAILLVLGITQFFGTLSRIKLVSPRWQTLISVGLVVILGIQNITYYFGVYRNQNYFQDATGEFAEKFGLELKELGSDYDYYLLGQPRIFAAFPTTVFLCPENKMYDLTHDTIDILVLTEGKSNVFVAIPENRSDLERIEEKYPGGTWEEVGRRYKDEVLYYAYILP